MKQKRGQLIIKQKRGQFYLIAAFIIIAIILGFVVISNYAKSKTTIRLYNLKEDLQIESENVLEYGTYNEFDENQIRDLLEDFTETYSTYVGEGIDIYFVFGNREKITVAGYQEVTSTIYIEDSSMMLTKGEYVSEEFYPVGNKVIVTMDGTEYEFKLKPGENFYFVISQEIGGEEHVVTG